MATDDRNVDDLVDEVLLAGKHCFDVNVSPFKLRSNQTHSASRRRESNRCVSTRSKQLV